MKKIFTSKIMGMFALVCLMAGWSINADAGAASIKNLFVQAEVSTTGAGAIYIEPAVAVDQELTKDHEHSADAPEAWGETDSFKSTMKYQDYPNTTDNASYWCDVKVKANDGYVCKGVVVSNTPLTKDQVDSVAVEGMYEVELVDGIYTAKVRVDNENLANTGDDSTDGLTDEQKATYGENDTKQRMYFAEGTWSETPDTYVYAVFDHNCTLNFSAEYDEMCDVWGVYANGDPLEYPYDNDNPYTFTEGTQISVGGMCTDADVLHEMVVTVNGVEVPADSFDPDTKVYTFTLLQDTNIKIEFKDPAPKTWTKTGYIMPSSSWGTDIFWTDACAQEVTVSGTEGSNELTISQDSKGYHNIIYVTANDDETCASISYDYSYYGWGYFDFGSSYAQYMNTSYCYANADEENGYVTLYGWFDNSDNQYYVDIDWYDGAKEDAEAWKGIVTGINNVNAADNNAPVYNIAGQRVNNAQKGIFIKNGKKFMVK